MSERGEPSVDVAGTLGRFAAELRRAGLLVSNIQLQALLAAFEWLNPARADHVYHACCATLLTRREDRALFDQVFDAFWYGQRAAHGQRVPLAPRQSREPRRPVLVNLLAQKFRAGDPELTVDDRTRAASADELLRRKDFSRLSEVELTALQRLFQGRRFEFAWRVTRRKVPRSRGKQLDLRRLPAQAGRAGGAVLRLPRRTAKIKPRPIVVLADVSGSMELYTRVLLQFFHALSRRLGRVESFVFATRLTRITSELGLRNIDRALDAVGAHVADFAGGTRIGHSLHAFNTRWAARALGRGAVVIIVSDGCESDDAASLAREVEILRERCHRLIWLNPRLGGPNYEPRVAGMAAALKHVDDFLTCHNLQSLDALEAHLARLPKRRGGGAGLELGSAA